jgi:8-oxo-dGTP pyrophosphatase MutT (NUDIX family)
MKKRKAQTVILSRDAKGNKYFLLLKMNKRRKHRWQNVTGSVDDGEDFDAAAIREAIEETGLVSNNIMSLHKTDLVFEFFDQWKKNVIEKVFVLECLDKWSIVLDPSEHEEYKWVDVDELDENLVHYPSNYTALKLAKDLFC